MVRDLDLLPLKLKIIDTPVTPVLEKVSVNFVVSHLFVFELGACAEETDGRATRLYA